MKYLAFLVFVIAAPVAAQDFPGLVSARLLPGWVAADGTRVAALEIVLEPGWKTYWRSPGETGIPPDFDWQGPMGAVAVHWPAPEVFHTAGIRALGYHDRLVLPFTVAPLAGEPAGALRAEVSFGLCRDVCVPVSLPLAVPGAGTAPDPVIEAALAAQPQAGAPATIRCDVAEAADGLRITAHLPEGTGEVVAELSDPDIWVSEPEMAGDGGRLTATFEAVAPDGKPFAVGPGDIRITLLGPQAVEFAACPLSAPQG